MKILFLSRLVPNEFRGSYAKVSGKIMDDASIGLQEKILLGLSENSVAVYSINVIPIFSYSTCKILRIPGFSFRYSLANGNMVEGENVKFNNLPYIKQISQNHQMKKAIRKALKTDQDVTVLAYSPFPAFFKAIISAKKAYPRLKICVIYPDLPSYMSLKKNRSPLARLYTKYNEKTAKNAEKYCDKAVFLTAHMSEVIHIPDYTVIEGIAVADERRQNKKAAPQNYIIYAGTLNERFGVLHLLKAFRFVRDPNLNVIICGIGDSEDIIKEMARTDLRIKFLGKQSQQTVLEYLSNARAIVNPRLPGEEFTKYSFPSKNLEALSSGVPFIAYKLPGIPDEYDDYINYPKDLSEKALAELIEEVCDGDAETYVKKAENAQIFVTENKNPKKMTERMIRFLYNDIG